MSFYNRGYGAGRLPPVIAQPVSQLPVERVGPAVRGSIVMVPVRPPPAAVYQPVLPPFPIGPQAAPLLFLQPRPVESLLPVTPLPVVPGPAVPVRVRPPRPTGQTMVFPTPSGPVVQPTGPVVEPRSKTPVSQDFVETNTPEPPAPRPRNPLVSPGTPGGSSTPSWMQEEAKWAPQDGGDIDYSVPEQEIPMNDGSTLVVAQTKSSVVVPVVAGATVGFLLGGPVGALAVAALGYFFGKPKTVAVGRY